QATDFDGDTTTLDANSLSVTVIDDIPIQNANTSTGVVEEEQLTGGNEDTTSGPPDLDDDTAGDSNVTTAVATGSLAPLVTVGADEPASFSLGSTSGLPALTSQGQTVAYDVTGNKLTGFVDSGPVGLDAGDPQVFTLELSGTNNATWTFTLLDQLDHPTLDGVAGDDTENTLALDLSSVIQATDFDGDTTTLDANSLSVTVIDDIPIQNPTTSTAVAQQAHLTDAT